MIYNSMTRRIAIVLAIACSAGCLNPHHGDVPPTYRAQEMKDLIGEEEIWLKRSFDNHDRKMIDLILADYVHGTMIQEVNSESVGLSRIYLFANALQRLYIFIPYEHTGAGFVYMTHGDRIVLRGRLFSDWSLAPLPSLDFPPEAMSRAMDEHVHKALKREVQKLRSKYSMMPNDQKVEIAENRATSEYVLSILASDEEVSVRRSVASNPNIGPMIAERLADTDLDSTVRQNAAALITIMSRPYTAFRDKPYILADPERGSEKDENEIGEVNHAAPSETAPKP